MVKAYQLLYEFKTFKPRQSQILEACGLVFAQDQKHICPKKMMTVTIMKHIVKIVRGKATSHLSSKAETDRKKGDNE